MERNEKQQLRSVLDEFESSLADIAGMFFIRLHGDLCGQKYANLMLTF